MVWVEKFKNLKEDESLILNEDQFEDYIMEMMGVSEEDKKRFENGVD